MSRSLLLLLTCLSTVAPFAHPGHDLTQHGASHLATSPYHLAFLSLVTFVSFGIAAFVRNRRYQLILCGTAVLSIVAVAILWTLR